MSSRSYDTQGKHEQQDWADQEWEELVKQRLPANLEEKAIELKAWSRQRGVRSIADLLRALLVYASLGYSFQMLGIWATAKGVANISETAWRKRLSQSAAWINWLVRAMLRGPKPDLAWLGPGQRQRRIMLIDATRIKTVGGTGDDLRLHWAYDLIGGQTEQVEITDHHDAESLRHFRLKKGDIAVQDAGYPVPTTVEEAEKQGIDVVLRVTASHLRLETEEGKVIKLKDQIKRQPYAQTRRLPGKVKMKDGTRRDVQLIAHRLPKEISQAAQERKRKQLQAKRGKRFNQDLVWWAGWVLLITTLDEKEWSSAEILRLYRARWQIELIFKRLKQLLDVHRISIQDWARAQIVAQLYLIVWLVQEGVQNWLRGTFQSLSQSAQGECLSEPSDEDDPQWVPSLWRIAQLGGEQVQLMLRGTWKTSRLIACLDQLRRYLFVRRRPKRPHQETAFRDWLSRKMSALAVTSTP
jgi:IS4 transposase